MRGAVGWAEWSPFAEYTRPEIDAWWQATVEAAEIGFPAPVRDRVPVNVTVPAVDARDRPRHRRGVRLPHGQGEGGRARPGPSATTWPGWRRCATRSGPDGRIRVDANGAWDVDTALTHLARLARFGLEYAEQPCASVERARRPCDAGWRAAASTS